MLKDFLTMQEVRTELDSITCLLRDAHHLVFIKQESTALIALSLVLLKIHVLVLSTVFKGTQMSDFIVQSSDGPFHIPISKEEENLLEKALGLNSHIVRLDNNVNDELLQAAANEGLIPQAYIRKVLREHLVGLTGNMGLLNDSDG